MTYTLVADGTSDRVLLPILTWSLKQHRVTPVLGQWADFSRAPRQHSTEGRLRIAVDLYPCDVLFVHRDAEKQPPSLRYAEIERAACGMAVRHIPVVPVRMTEAWLLADERAIRWAAGNPNGRDDLQLPSVRRLEELPDPKKVLWEALAAASGLHSRRRSHLPVPDRVHRIPDYIDDFSCLNVLPAFQALQRDIRELAGSLV